jgi:beta-lactam-binding protein with PASTA domain
MKKLALHVLLAIVLTLALIWFAIAMLKGYTRHGKVFVVPDYIGLDHHKVISEYGKLFNFIVTDSIYQKDGVYGSVLQQDPYPGAKVKQGRNIYLVIVARQPEKVAVPNLLNLSLRQALASLESAGLELGEISYTTHFARNAVVSQTYKGANIEAGTQLFKGSTIDLVLGDGGEDFRVPFPMLIGLRPEEVKQSLHSLGLNLGNEYFIDGCTREKARAFKLQPFMRTSEAIKPGTYITIWYKSEDALNFNRYVRDSLYLFTNEPIADSLDIPDENLE